MKYIRIYETQHTGKLEFIKLAFRTEDIDFNVLFEQSLETEGPLALGDNGAIIEVAESDVEQAKTILEEQFGIVLNYDKQLDEFKWLSLLKQSTVGSIPLLRFLMYIFFFSGFSLMVWAIIDGMTLKESYFTESTWCVEKVIHYNETKTPKILYTAPAQTHKYCDENIVFRKDASIVLPSFKNYGIYTTWKLTDDNSISISETETLNDIYQGVYQVDKKTKGRMQLSSEHTTIYLKRSKGYAFHLPF